MIFNLQNGENGVKLKDNRRKKAFTARLRDGFLWMLRSARIE